MHSRLSSEGDVRIRVKLYHKKGKEREEEGGEGAVEPI